MLLDYFLIGLALASYKQIEIFVFLDCFLEGENSSGQGEKNDARAENVDLAAIVGFSLLDLWRHIGFGASVAF